MVWDCASNSTKWQICVIRANVAASLKLVSSYAGKNFGSSYDNCTHPSPQDVFAHLIWSLSKLDGAPTSPAFNQSLAVLRLMEQARHDSIALRQPLMIEFVSLITHPFLPLITPTLIACPSSFKQVKFPLLMLDLQAPHLITSLFDTLLRIPRCEGDVCGRLSSPHKCNRVQFSCCFPAFLTDTHTSS